MIAFNDIYPTVQGEGVLAGTPMVLIRLQGCAVGCPWCDTKETWKLEDADRVEEADAAAKEKPKWSYVYPAEIARMALEMGPNLRWALLTGGEPAEQDLRELVGELHGAGFRVALETSGTANGFEECGIDWVCISPKVDMPGGIPFNPRLLRHADEIKQVVSSPKDIEHLAFLITHCVMKPTCVVSIQPVSKNEKATRLCIKACLERGWNLSIQTHRYIDVK
jgi:7-carboxy-7-deazaguanine synthase